MKHLLYIALSIGLLACSKQDPEPPKSSFKTIRSFSFNTLNPPISATLDSVQQTITATFPIGTDMTKLAPTIALSEKATVSPASGVIQDFSKPVSYTVTAENGSTRVYTTKFTILKSSARSILSFAFRSLTPAVTATIDSVNRVITATIPVNTDLTKLVPTISISDRATVSPASGTAQNFSKDVTYTVMAENGESRVYTVKISTVKSSAKFIKNFYFNDLSPNGFATIDTTAKTIAAVLPVGTNLTKLVPTIIVSDKSSVSPGSGVAQNFLNTIPRYTVTAENGSQQDYRAYVVTIADKPLGVTLYGKTYTWKTALCSLTTFPRNSFMVQLFDKDVACSTKTSSAAYVEFNIPISGMGTFWTDGAYFHDNKGTSSTYFNCMVQITKITNTTIEGKVIAGSQYDGNLIEGNFVAQLCL